ncbi:hypothetical protein M8J77_022660 [Diaphorina citri]|nr:hypothetical protein M8J77_022660 [Diaphorina citri]
MAISSFPVNHFFLSIYLLSSVQFTYHIPLPQKENDVVLSEYIRHYEPAIYDPDKIQRQQRRLRRSAAHQHGADPVEPLRINITASHRIRTHVLSASLICTRTRMLFRNISGCYSGISPDVIPEYLRMLFRNISGCYSGISPDVIPEYLRMLFRNISGCLE